MRALVPIAVLVALSYPAAAGDRDFNAVVRSVETNLDVHRAHIPGMWFAKLVIRIAHPAGAKQLDFAIFEHVRTSKRSIADLDRAVRSATDERWTPIVRARSGHEWSVIYTRFDGNDHVRMLIATVDSEEAVVVHLKLDAGELASMLDENPRYAKHYGHRIDSE